MAKRRKPKGPDPDSVHREMLEHLAGNPPPRPKKSPRTEVPPAPEPAARPQLMLRQLRLTTALHRLGTFVAQSRLKGTAEVLVIVGRGLQSGQDGPVISPAVQEWCDQHPDLVRSWDFAPGDEGGSGALVLHLTRPA